MVSGLYRPGWSPSGAVGSGPLSPYTVGGYGSAPGQYSPARAVRSRAVVDCSYTLAAGTDCSVPTSAPWRFGVMRGAVRISMFGVTGLIRHRPIVIGSADLSSGSGGGSWWMTSRACTSRFPEVHKGV